MAHATPALVEAEKKFLDIMGDLCFALYEKEQMESENAKGTFSEKQAAVVEAACSQLKEQATHAKKEYDRLEAEAQEVSPQTASDMTEIKKLMLDNPITMKKWESGRQCQLAFCMQKRISLPTFSDPDVRVSITVDDGIEFVRLPTVSKSYAVLGNSEHGKVVVVFEGEIIW